MTRIHIESDQKETVTTLVGNSLTMQQKMLQAGLKRTKARLKTFEKEFGQSSRKFYRAYQTGRMGDEEKIMEWAGEWETYQALTQAVTLLKEAEVC